MKRRTTIALMFALLATAGIGSQKFCWGEDLFNDASVDAAKRQDETAKRNADAAKRQADDARRQADNVRRQTEEMKRQAKEMARQQGRFLRNNPDSIEAQIHNAAEALRDAEGDEAKAKAAEELKSVLDKYFEEDMKNRQEAVGDLEQRLQKLKAQLDRRREKKQDIIELQMKIAKNEAEGLGFYSEPSGAPFIYRMGPNIDADLDGAPYINVRVPAPARIPGPPEPKGEAPAGSWAIPSAGGVPR